MVPSSGSGTFQDQGGQDWDSVEPASQPGRASAVSGRRRSDGGRPSSAGRHRRTKITGPAHPGSIYIGLLEAVLDERESSPTPESASEALARLVQYRRKVIWRRSATGDPDWAAGALADQVAYDSALIVYARQAGIECDHRRFGIPGVERARIERLLEARGIPLGP